MMESELYSVVEEIGRIADNAEASKWALAMHIANAYAEFKPYEKGLTMGLCARLRRSPDSIYGYRDAENLRERLGLECVLSVSHFVVLNNLADNFALSDDTLKEWVARAEEDKLSVRALRQEVSIEHTKDAKLDWIRRLKRAARLFDTLFADSTSVGLPEPDFQAIKTIQAAIGDLMDSVGEWKD